MAIFPHFIFFWPEQDWPAPTSQEPLPAGLIGDEI